MHKINRISLAAVGGMFLSSSVMAQTAVGTMLGDIDTATVAGEVGTWAAGAVAVFLALAAIPMAKKLIRGILG